MLDGLAGFEGVRRRFELVGTAHGVRVFDDYAHHPTEVRATLGAVRTVTEQSGRGRSVVVFQPHLYSRTAAFAREFGQALDAADEVFVLDVYAAREQPMAGISGATVAEHVGKPVHYVPDFSAVADLVADAVHPATSSSRWARATSRCWAPRSWRHLQVRANRATPPRRPETGVR